MAVCALGLSGGVVATGQGSPVKRCGGGTGHPAVANPVGSDHAPMIAFLPSHFARAGFGARFPASGQSRSRARRWARRAGRRNSKYLNNASQPPDKD